MRPYYDADGITLYHGDCREVTAWLEADVLVTDPPYGIGYICNGSPLSKRDAIKGDTDTAARDDCLRAWGDRPALVFGSWRSTAPVATRQLLVWDKGEQASGMGSGPWWNAHEDIYVLGKGFVGKPRPNVLRVNTLARAGAFRAALGHPTPKPVSLLESLIECCPPGVIADPFAGSGSTLLAARSAGRRAIGVEMEERYCELIASRLAQGDLFGDVA